MGADDNFSFKNEFALAQQKFLEKFPTHEHLIDLIDRLKDIIDEERDKLKQNIAIIIWFGENSICYQSLCGSSVKFHL